MDAAWRGVAASVLLCMAVLCFPIDGALAFFTATKANNGNAINTASVKPLPTGSGVAVSGRDVTVSWPGDTLNDTPATPTTYTISRDGAAIGSGGCSGTQSAAARSCTDTGVSSATHTYVVTPTYHGWTGTGSGSLSAVVGSPTLGLSQTTFTSLPASPTATLTNFLDGQTVTFRLDNASTGTVLTTSPTTVTIATGGGATATVTIPLGTSNGSHTVFATDPGGDSGSIGITVNAVTVSSLLLSNVGSHNTAGLPEQGDTIAITFSTAIPAGTICSGWNGSTLNSNNDLTVVLHDGGSGNDTVTFTAAVSCGSSHVLHVGSIDLGSTGFNTTGSNITFSGTGNNATSMVLTSGTTLTITLGKVSPTSGAQTVSTSVTAVYTPDATLGVSGTGSHTAVQF